MAITELRQKPRVAVNIIGDLLDLGASQPVINRQRLWVLAGLRLMELGLTGARKDDFGSKQGRIRDGMVAILQDPQALNIVERAEAGRVLGSIGDPRSGAGLTEAGWPDIDWRKIPAGEVALEGNAGRFPVESFYLARYPVTDAQFQAFIDDPEGYSNHQWWEGLDAEPGTVETSHWQAANHPRETVSWFEAMAFCAWLSERLGYEIRLPTEWQWQQAACSGHADYKYPWRGEYKSGYANIDETGGNVGLHNLQRTAAVGIYPQGDSEQGVSDLSGNVWEWCLNEYDQPSNVQATGSERRVVRGGSWIFDQDYARASLRYYSGPGIRVSSLGFRLCCFSPI